MQLHTMVLVSDPDSDSSDLVPGEIIQIDRTSWPVKYRVAIPNGSTPGFRWFDMTDAGFTVDLAESLRKSGKIPAPYPALTAFRRQVSSMVSDITAVASQVDDADRTELIADTVAELRASADGIDTLVRSGVTTGDDDSDGVFTVRMMRQVARKLERHYA